MSLSPNRSKFIGASEVAACLGVNPWKSRLKLWHEKKGNIPPDDLSAKLSVQLGIHCEPFAAEWWSKTRGIAVERATEYLVSETTEGAGASLDYWTLDGAGRRDGLVEIKTISQRSASYWDDGPPLHYTLQVQQQLALAKMERGWLVALVAGERELLQFPIKARQATQSIIDYSISTFWDSIRDNTPPDPKPEIDDETQARLAALREPSDVVVEGTSDHGDLLAKYVSLSAVRRNTDKELRVLKGRIVATLEEAQADRLVAPNGYKVKPTRTPPTVIKEFTRDASVRLYASAPRA